MKRYLCSYRCEELSISRLIAAENENEALDKLINQLWAADILWEEVSVIHEV